jgi:uncharacterized protein (DUF885 family)
MIPAVPPPPRGTRVPRSPRPPLLLALPFLLCAAVTAGAADEPQRLRALFDAYWDRQMAENPVWASQLGDHRHDDEWPDLSPGAIAASHAADRADLARLRAIEPEGLTPEDRLNRDLLELRLVAAIEGHAFRGWLTPLNQRGGVQTLDQVGERIRMDTVEDYEAWLTRLERLPAHLAQTRALMEQGLEEGVVWPRVIMERVPRQLRRQLVDDPEASLYWSRFADIPASIPDAEAQRLRERARRVIAERVVPAYAAFTTFFEETYLPGTPAAVGLSARPNGHAHYAHLAARFTTTDLTPDRIHEIGLAEVRRIRKEMDAVIAEVGFEGSFGDFLEFLRSDPQFYFDDPQELLAAYRATAKRIDPELVRLFGRLPRTPYGVKPIPEAIAPDTTTAYYMPPAGDGSRPGWYYVNLYRPEVRPKYEIEVLTVHESVPGHHLQIALAQEREDQPTFRRYTRFTAFTEGWGLYSERLGYEIGLYEDPYSRFGALTYDMWRAVRLVVDTGMHAKGWSRERAIEYFAANAAKTRHDIVNEIDRYIGMPGQALAYKIGQLKILELRERAESELGAAFDVRAFHDVVLSQGAVPLGVLEATVEAWLAERTDG